MTSITDHDDGSNNEPQELVNEFWENLITKKPAKVTKIFPSSLYANLLPPQRKPGVVKGKNAAESYEVAARECRARVKRIVQECERTNEKFTDPEFDIEDRPGNCLAGLMKWYEDLEPTSAAEAVSAARLGYALRTLIQADVLLQDGASFNLSNTANALLNSSPISFDGGPGPAHRIDWIFEDPKFKIDGFTSSDVVQGGTGDCWFIAAVATICSNPDLIEKVCVERNEECGVYGFVFHRDGEWIWTVVDDNLFLAKKDFDARGDTYDPTGSKEMRYKKNYQTGSEALYFASCAHENETWLPLLEKAYAKVHGDYDSISGGISGEAVEDLTGGVTSKILTDRVLSKERLWKELKLVNEGFLFSASSPGSYGDDSSVRRGLALSHAYSIIKAVEVETEDKQTKHRLVLIRNPWGKRADAAMGEWTGPWSDGSQEWTPYWMEKLEHKFGDDGLFWMSYEDLLKRFELLDRTRLFDQNWTVVQNWTSASVAWVTGYLNTKFSVQVKKKGPTVFQLCQLDDRYFQGLTGKYTFDLHFVLQEKDAAPGDHIVRARGAWFGNRSISAEVELEPGIYEVLPKIEAKRNAEIRDVHEVVMKLTERNPQKLRQIGLNYDIANAKGIVESSEDEARQKGQKKKEAAEKKKKEETDEVEKEKAEFEAWKREEREEYEAWKRQKKRSTRNAMAEETESQADDTKASELMKGENASASSAEAKERTPTGDVTGAKDIRTNADTFSGAEEEKPKSDSSSAKLVTKAGELEVGDENKANSDEKAKATVEAGAPPPTNDKPKPWNAVCVLGLRVYSQDPEVSIKLVKPKNVEEGAILDVDGDTAAGATM